MKSAGGSRFDTGAAAIEFALISSFLLVPLLFGLLQYGLLFYVDSSATGVAGQLARYIAVGNCRGAGAAQAFADARIPVDNSVTVTTMPTSTTTIGTSFTVEVTAEAGILSVVPMPNGGDVTATVSSRVEDNTGSACP